MKVNSFTLILSLALAGIISFFLSYYISGENKFILGIGSFITLALSLAGTVSLSFDYKRTTVLTKIVSSVCFAIFLISQIVFTTINEFMLPNYLLVTGGSTILYILIIYGLSKSQH
jgi:hypothetical protein